MAPQLTHDEVQQLLGAFAIDAVEADEAAAVEDHLRDCPRCRAEVAQHREAASLLAFSGETAPDALWSRIASSLDEAPPPIRLLGESAPARRAPSRLVLAAAGLAAAVMTVLGIRVADQDRRIDQLSALSNQRGLEQAAAAAAVAPGARTVRLTSDSGTALADAIVLPDGRGYLVQTKLPALDGDHTYQLWGVMGAQTISLGVLGPTPDITSFRAAGPLSALAISTERAGGAVAPTRAPLAQGFVRT